MGFEVTFSPTSLRKSGENSIIFIYIYPGNPEQKSTEVASILRPFCVDFAPVLRRFCARFASILRPFCVDFASILCRFCVDSLSILRRFSVDFASILCRFCARFASILRRSCVDLASIFCLFSVDFRPVLHILLVPLLHVFGAPSECAQFASIPELAQHFPVASSSGGRLSTRPQHSVR
jgi:hypothetical protein